MSTEDKKEPKKKEDEIVTIRDFKAMIVGMDMIMGDDWTPNESQWKRIRAKINALIETEERPGGVVNTRPPLNSVVPGANVSDTHLLAAFPTVPGGVPDSVPVGEAGPTGPSALAPPPRVPAPAMPSNAPVADGREQVKTPDIDSTAGYKSGFV